MIFEKFNPKTHNTKEIATLTYDVDYRTFSMLYKNKEEAILAIEEKLIKESNNNYLLYVILDDDNTIIGMVSLSTNKKPSLFRENLFLFRNLKIIDAFKLSIINFLDSRVLSDFNKGDLYIAEIAISSSERGKGLGKQVLNIIIEKAKEKNFKRVTLDADFRNKGAYKLYKSLGFKVFKKKNFKIINFERGMYNMEFKL